MRSPRSPQNLFEVYLAQYEHLPIYKSAFDLLVYFEKIVTRFSRYNKYTHGTALRDTAREIVILIVRANNSWDKRPVLSEMRIKLEELKVLVRICKEIQAFPNLNSYKTSINYIINISKQNEGWMRSLSKNRKRPESQPGSKNRIGA